MSHPESGNTPDNLALSPYERAILDIMRESRENADKKIVDSVRMSNFVTNTAEHQVSYRTLAQQEAKKLGHLIVKRSRLAVRVTTNPELRMRIRHIDKGDDEAWRAVSRPFAKEISTPVLLADDPVQALKHMPEDTTELEANVAPLSLARGWRFGVRVVGSDIAGFFASLMPISRDISKQVTSLRVQEVLFDQESGNDRIVADDIYGICSLNEFQTPHHELPDNHEFFVHQTGLLMVAQKVINAESHQAGLE